MHLVPLAIEPGDRAQEMDRRIDRAARRGAGSMPARRGQSRPAIRCCLPACGGWRGTFKRGDCVLIRAETGEIGRGLVAYSADKAERIIGRRSSEIEHVLGAPGRAELIHRDDMVLAGD